MRTLALLHTVSLLAVVQAASIQVKGNDTSINYVGSGWKTRVGCEYLYTMYSFKEGDYLQWDFTGTEVYVYGPKSENGGILSVTLDTTLSMVDRWLNYESDCSGVIFWQNELPNTRHTLKIAFDGPSPSNKTGDPYVEIQYIRYTVPGVSDSIVPTSTSAITTASTTSTSIPLPSSDSMTSSPAAGPNIATIVGAIGGVLGGLAVVAVVVFLLWRKRRKQRRRIMNSETQTDIDPTDVGHGEPGSRAAMSPIAQPWSPISPIAHNLSPYRDPFPPSLYPTARTKKSPLSSPPITQTTETQRSSTSPGPNIPLLTPSSGADSTRPPFTHSLSDFGVNGTGGRTVTPGSPPASTDPTVTNSRSTDSLDVLPPPYRRRSPARTKRG